MKKIIISLISLTLLSTGCNEDKFLTKVNPNTITQETFWNSAADFQSALTTVYGALQFPSVSGGSRLQNEEVMTDLGGTDSWYPGFTFRVLTFNDATQYVNDKWNQLYIGIFRANQVIERIQTTDIELSTNEINEIEAQAKALRAFFYFELVNTYGQAVLHTKVPVEKEDFKKPLVTGAEITKQLIIPDLEFAIENLPLTWSNSDMGRTTKGMAQSLLGKVQLFNKNYADAAKHFKAVIDSKVYRLENDPMTNFTDANEFNSESIFEVAFNGSYGAGIPAGNVDDTPFSSGAESSDFTNVLAPLPKGGFNTLVPSYFIHELLINDEMDPDNTVNLGKKESRRLFASIFPKNGEGEYYQLENTQSVFFNPFHSAFIKKYTNWYKFKNEDPVNNKTGINFRHIRLADVYLMYAEALLNVQGESAVNEALNYIDLVRARAGVITLKKYMENNSGQFPQLHISKQVHGAYPMVAANAENILIHIMRVERPLELCFEGHRWNDLKRWGIVKQVYDEMRADEVWRVENSDKFTVNFAPLYINGQNIRIDFNLASQNYNSASHDYLPIPSNEVQANDNL